MNCFTSLIRRKALLYTFNRVTITGNIIMTLLWGLNLTWTNIFQSHIAPTWISWSLENLPRMGSSPQNPIKYPSTKVLLSPDTFIIIRPAILDTLFTGITTRIHSYQHENDIEILFMIYRVVYRRDNFPFSYNLVSEGFFRMRHYSPCIYERRTLELDIFPRWTE